MRKIHSILIGLLLTAAAIVGASCEGGGVRIDSSKDKEMYRNLDNVGIPRSVAEFRHSFTTPGGIKVRSTVPIPANAQAEMENGIRRTIERHTRAYPAWTKARSLSDVNVLFIDPMATNEIHLPGSPAILVRGIQSCGTGIGINYAEARDRETQYLVLPHQAATHWRFLDYLNNCAAHEWEHLIEFENDYQIFTRWNYNDIHPRPFELCGTDPMIPC